MPAKKNKGALHTRLLEGFEIKSRADGSVHTIKANGRTVAEVCVGAKKVRLNLRKAANAPKGIELTGKSKSWAGGGCIVTDENLAAARALLTAAAKPPASSKPKRTRSSRKVVAAA